MKCIYNPTMSTVFQHPLVPPRTSQPQVWRRPAFASPGTCPPATCATVISRCTRSPTTSWPMPSMRRTSTSPTPLWTSWGWRWTRTTSSRSRPTPVVGPALGATVCTSGLLDAVSALDGERNWKAPSSFAQLCFGDNSLEETPLIKKGCHSHGSVDSQQVCHDSSYMLHTHNWLFFWTNLNLRSLLVMLVSYFPFKYGFKIVRIPVLTRIHF